MLHWLYSHPMKFRNRIIQLPSFKFLLNFFIMLVVSIREKMSFRFNEGKHFNLIIYLLPCNFWIYPKFKPPPIFKLKLHLIYTLIGCIFGKFINFTEREENPILMSDQAYLIICEDKFCLWIFSISQFTEYKLFIMQYCNFSLLDLIFL